MRRFPFFIGPLVGLVLLFFLLKILFVVLFGAAVLGAGAIAFRNLCGHRDSHLRVAYLRQQQQPTPIDSAYSEPAFNWMDPKGRIVEIV